MDRSNAPRWWEWPSVLCLEAPVIAVLWQALSARVLSAPLALYHRVLLGLAVWLAYAADRWTDTWRRDADTARHRFARRWRWPILSAWIPMIAVSVGYAVMSLGPDEWRLSALGLGASAALVLGAARLRDRVPFGEMLWRIFTATVFATGVLLFVVPGARAPLWTVAGWGAVMWIVFWGNLEVIERFETLAPKKAEVAHAWADVAIAVPALAVVLLTS